MCVWGGGGYVKKQNLWGGYVKNRTSGGHVKNRNSRGVQKSLSMLPLVGGSPYSRGLLLLVGSRGYLRGNRAICRGT